MLETHLHNLSLRYSGHRSVEKLAKDLEVEAGAGRTNRIYSENPARTLRQGIGTGNSGRLRPTIYCKHCKRSLEPASWRFKSPGPIKKDVAVEFEKLIMTIAEQGDFQRVIEHFKDRFSYGQSTMWSSSSSWSVCDMQGYMETAAENAPRFVAAFVDGCESQAASGKDVPDIDIINEILATHEAGYQVIGGTVVSTAELPEEQVSGSAVAFEPPIHTASSAVKPDTFPNYASVAKANEPMALKAFLCHASGDKPRVKDLYHALKRDGFAPWLDAINLLPGQDWEAVITAEVRASHVVIVCLSRSAVTKAGFAQLEEHPVAGERPEHGPELSRVSGYQGVAST